MGKEAKNFAVPEHLKTEVLEIGRCPFPHCHSEKTYLDEIAIDGSVYRFVCCSDCCAEGPLSADEETAVALWNAATDR